ncbi:hypothetical protein ACO2Q8_06975 [Larkinella sp. VNQ87]|uniref:hypothetical protein n=1 Tax=Larkinella sp. VNQ87 TaxID=3400921 RepID=UPI003C0B1875
MVKFLKAFLAVLMVVTWLGTAVLFFMAPTRWGRIAIIGSGILINILLAIGHSCLGRRPATWRDWFKM